MGFGYTLRQAFSIHCEAVVHGYNFNFTRGMIFYRMVCAMVTLMHFCCFSTKRQCQHLVTQTYSKYWNAGFQDVLDHRN